MLGYIFVGILVTSIFATILGYYSSYIISIVLLVAFFIGLLVVQRITTKKTILYEKVVHFNLAIFLTNLNNSLLVPQFKIKAKVGYQAQWIEFHSLTAPPSTMVGA